MYILAYTSDYTPTPPGGTAIYLKTCVCAESYNDLCWWSPFISSRNLDEVFTYNHIWL